MTKKKKYAIFGIRLLSLQSNFTPMSDKKVIYPQNFDIKLIIAAEIAMEEAKRNISQALSESQTVHSFVNVRSSGKGNYLSYCYNIDIESKEHLERTYALLKTIPGLKFAL
jgi:putative lipoic acid-binding regulatory protein